jgi:hypothetical protein
MQSLPKSLELYMEMRQDGGERLEGIIMTPGVEPRFTCQGYTCRFPEAENLTASELITFYMKNVRRQTFNVYVNYDKMNIWTILFVAKGFMEGSSMECVFGHCLLSNFARVGQEELPATPVACDVKRKLDFEGANQSSVYLGTRSRMQMQMQTQTQTGMDIHPFAFESIENKIIRPPPAEEDYTDMPALISVKHANALQALEEKEAALKTEAKQLDELGRKVDEVQALWDSVGPRRILWCCEEMKDGEVGLAKLKADYEEELAELNDLEAKVAAVKALKASVEGKRATLIAAIDSI